jgi:hypothetical protein
VNAGQLEIPFQDLVHGSAIAPPFQMEFNLRLIESYERRLQCSPEEFLTAARHAHQRPHRRESQGTPVTYAAESAEEEPALSEALPASDDVDFVLSGLADDADDLDLPA